LDGLPGRDRRGADGGRHLLLATNDNDFVLPSDAKGYWPNYILAYAADRGDVPEFQQETFICPPLSIGRTDGTLLGLLEPDRIIGLGIGN
jgi:hypothetical protein